MKSLKRWASAIALDIALATCFYQWQFNNVDGAGNVFMFIVWLFAFLGMLLGFMKPDDKKKIQAGPAFRIYQGMTDTGVIVALAWTGSYVTAVAYLFGSLTVAAARRKPDASEAVAS